LNAVRLKGLMRGEIWECERSTALTFEWARRKGIDL